MSRLFLLAFGRDDGTLNLQHRAWLAAIGFHLDGLLERSSTPYGAEGHLDGPLFARLDGLGGIFGPGAAARCSHISENQWLISGVGEFKLMCNWTFRFLDGAA